MEARTNRVSDLVERERERGGKGFNLAVISLGSQND